MTEQLLWQAFDDQIKHFDARIDPRRRPGAAPHWIVVEMPEIAPAMARLAAGLAELQETPRRAALGGRIKAIQLSGTSVLDILDAASRLCDAISKLCLAAVAAGHTIESLPEFDRAAHQIRPMPESWRCRWPFVDAATIEKSSRDLADGRFQSARDVFHELRSHHARKYQA